MSVAIHINSLTETELKAMERHGKRQDEIGKARQINDRPPLTFNSLNIVDEYNEHVDSCRMNKGAKNICQHAIIQFPTDIDINEKSERAMLNEAVNFINGTYGGNAVFAARLDRDEKGQHSVDVFFAPKYLKETARTRRGEVEPELWISNTKHGKDLCQIHREEIIERNRELAELKRAKNEEAGRPVLIGPLQGTFSTGPRQVGIALQSELREKISSKHARLAEMIKPKKKKAGVDADRLEPEEYGLRKDREALEREREELKADRAAAEQEFSKMRQTASEEWAKAAKAKIEVEKVLEETKTLSARVKKMGLAIREAIFNVADKLGVTREFKAIQSALNDMEEVETRLKGAAASVVSMYSKKPEPETSVSPPALEEDEGLEDGFDGPEL